MASEKVVHLTDDSFDEQTGSGYVMIDFWAEWCGPCRALAPVIDSIAESHSEQIKVCKLDVDSNHLSRRTHAYTRGHCERAQGQRVLRRCPWL